MPSSKRRPPAPRRQPVQQQRNRPVGWKAIVAGIGVVVVAVAAVIAISAANSGDDGAGKGLAEKIDLAAANLPAGQQDGLALGGNTAPLVLEAFEDFQCPYCIRFIANSEPAIVDEFVATGKVRFVYQNFPILGAESEAAARASVCAADQGKGWEYLLALFSKQAEAGQVGNEKLNVGRFDKSGLEEIANSVGIRGDILGTCMDAGPAAESVANQFARGKSLGVSGTPSFVLNGKVIANAPDTPQGWRDFLNQALADAAR